MADQTLNTADRLLIVLQDEHIQLLLLQIVALIALYVNHRAIKRRPPK